MSCVQMFPTTLKLDLFVTAFGLLALKGQLIRTGGRMHTSKSAMPLSGLPQSRSCLLPADWDTQLSTPAGKQPKPLHHSRSQSLHQHPACCSADSIKSAHQECIGLQGVTTVLLCCADSAAGQQREEAHGAKKPQAMRLKFTQHPQDKSSDAAVHFVLAPSYVTYNAATIQQVQEFFKTEEASSHLHHSGQACVL